MSLVAITIIFLVVGGASLTALSAIRANRGVARLASRPCGGARWRECFPGADKNDIRDFLFVVSEIFGIPMKKRLSLYPDDRLLDIYRVLYPGPVPVDDMELERLALECESRYGLELPSFTAETTLAEIFGRIKK